MPDISMCLDKTCIVRERCYRFMAEPERKWQSYLLPPKKRGRDGSCEHFVPPIEWPEGKK